MHKPIKKLDHIAIAVHSIDRAATFYTEHLGLSVSHIEEVPTQGVRVAFIPVGDIRIELVEPLHDNTPISKFLHKRGEGLHHLCFETEQIEQLHHALQQKQLRLLQKQPQPGAHQTQIAFIHPAENAGVLTELAMYPKGDPQRTIHNASNSQIASRTASKPDTNTTVQQDPSGISPKQRKGIKTMDTPHIHTIDGSSDETSESWMALRTFFEQSYKPRHTWRIGIEYEVSGIQLETMEPLSFHGEHSIATFMAHLREQYNPQKVSWEDDYCYGMTLPYGNITLEPGGQIEYSSPPVASMQEAKTTLYQFLSDLCAFGQQHKIVFYVAGVNPFHSLKQMPWSQKARYKVMREYLIQQGRFAHVMMQQTMSLQFNIDYLDEQDAVQKYNLARALYPTLEFLSYNSYIYEQKPLQQPFRPEVWQEVDNRRSGLPPKISSFDDYVDYLLDVPIFLLIREGKTIPVADGTTFRQYLQHGWNDLTPTYADWEQHISTLFPEVRFKKNALELRMFDGNSPEYFLAFTALIKGLFYAQTQPSCPDEQWKRSWAHAQALIDFAKDQLSSEEQVFLQPLEQSIRDQKHPGEVTRDLFQKTPPALLNALKICVS